MIVSAFRFLRGRGLIVQNYAKTDLYASLRMSLFPDP